LNLGLVGYLSLFHVVLIGVWLLLIELRMGAGSGVQKIDLVLDQKLQTPLKVILQVEFLGME